MYSLSRPWAMPVSAAIWPWVTFGLCVAERFDHVADIVLTACGKHVWAYADTLHDGPHFGQGQSHGALPVPLVARLME